MCTSFLLSYNIKFHISSESKLLLWRYLQNYTDINFILYFQCILHIFKFNIKDPLEFEKYIKLLVNFGDTISKFLSNVKKIHLSQLTAEYIADTFGQSSWITVYNTWSLVSWLHCGLVGIITIFIKFLVWTKIQKHSTLIK